MQKQQGESQGRYKRPFDLAVLIVSHVLLAPLFLLLWSVIPVLVLLGDRGPIFYRQRRAGKDGRTFIVRKFRTMIPDADRSGPAWTVAGDRRLTRVGRVLRRTALDELPQLLNVWKGDISLVGPRALPVDEQRMLEEQVRGFRSRLTTRPGLTGLAQVYNRTDEPYAKLRYDLEYIRRRSIWLDLKLLALSACNSLLARWDARSGKELYDYADENSGGFKESQR